VAVVVVTGGRFSIGRRSAKRCEIVKASIVVKPMTTLVIRMTVMIGIDKLWFLLSPLRRRREDSCNGDDIILNRTTLVILTIDRKF